MKFSPNLKKKELNQRLFDNDESVLEEIFNKYWELLFSRAYAILENEDDVKDIIQVVLTDVWERGDDATEKVKEFITENDYPFYVLRDFDGSTPKKYNVNGIPTKCIIDTAGYIRYQHSGGDSDIAKAVNEITTVIEIIK